MLRITAFIAASTQLCMAMLTLNANGPQMLNVNWAGVRSITFAAGDNAPGSQFVFDNFRFNNTPDPMVRSVIPEWATIVLMGTGLFGVGVVAHSAGQPRVSPDLSLHVFGAT